MLVLFWEETFRLPCSKQDSSPRPKMWQSWLASSPAPSPWFAALAGDKKVVVAPAKAWQADEDDDRGDKIQ